MLKDPQRINKFITEALALEYREAKDAGALGFMSRALVNCTMPHSKLKEPYYLRKNGVFSLAMMGHPETGIPYGSLPRLIMAYITTEAVKTQSPEIILGDSMNGFMRELGIVKSGGRWGSVSRLKTQMERLVTCSISCRYSDEASTVGKNIPLVDEYSLWWEPKQPDQMQLFQSSLTLSKKFFDEVIEAPVPIDLGALKVLKQSAMAIDLYTWITYRNSYAKKNSFIPWESLQLQFGAGYPETPQGKRNFKKKFVEALKGVSVVYPEAEKLRPETDHLLFVPGRPHIAKKLITIDNG